MPAVFSFFVAKHAQLFLRLGKDGRYNCTSGNGQSTELNLAKDAGGNAAGATRK
jgi:hypothetical protein